MPFGDRTGPLGQGPKSGSRAGLCSGSGAPGFLSQGGGCGSFGGGRGGGRGRRNRFHATGLTGWQRAADTDAGPGREQGLVALLKSQAERLEAALAAIRKRIQGLEARAKPE